jgi:hypothetical protein
MDFSVGIEQSPCASEDLGAYVRPVGAEENAKTSNVAPIGRRYSKRMDNFDANGHLVAVPGSRIFARRGFHVTAIEGTFVIARSNSHVCALRGSRVTALANAHVTALSGSTVVAFEQSFVTAMPGAIIEERPGAVVQYVDEPSIT